jgi:hypothetical protein
MAACAQLLRFFLAHLLAQLFPQPLSFQTLAQPSSRATKVARLRVCQAQSAAFLPSSHSLPLPFSPFAPFLTSNLGRRAPPRRGRVPELVGTRNSEFRTPSSVLRIPLGCLWFGAAPNHSEPANRFTTPLTYNRPAPSQKNPCAPNEFRSESRPLTTSSRPSHRNPKPHLYFRNLPSPQLFLPPKTKRTRLVHSGLRRLGAAFFFRGVEKGSKRGHSTFLEVVETVNSCHATHCTRFAGKLVLPRPEPREWAGGGVS